MTPGVRPLIAGNWKMHGLAADGLALARAVAAGGEGIAAEILVCPPATLVMAVAAAVQGGPVAVGGQDCHLVAKGAHTGDVSAPMLADAGARYVIVGHSERRADHHETDAVVKAKAASAIAHGLVPIVCVGETLAQREAGEAESVVRVQVAGSLPEGFVAAGGVVAYEPVWAIGTGRTPTEADIAAIHAALRQAVGPATRLLYGGSVKPGNAAAILALPNVDGALVGGASLVAEDFLAIARAAG
ncbi:triose-phosphate isomerase [Roseomonas oryzicola]|uniref:Triosephosphate isomerase n=1 Tax=Neoroseomonas oryzicola TaxID=535904 RepID=A0A9X9WEQ7_9PROT|nr:triose-phosphate isomerase [Neoroseomonas oryzicola]MBR0658817.1 triose-phosphate isomerase [Neoroseomonas oryzicola]NKE17295.1 triose-phosphate isomerase [Neoroseomonas oryzicola]